jgi:hypothetical protein
MNEIEKLEASAATIGASREQFEAWAKQRAGRLAVGLYPQLLCRNPHDREGYLMSWVDCAWMGWKASREELVIELPTQLEPEDPQPCDWQNGGAEMRARCWNAIEAAGVRVKS